MFTDGLYFDKDSGGAGAPAAAGQQIDPPQPPVVPVVPPPTDGDLSGSDGASAVGHIQMTGSQLTERLERAKNSERAAMLKALGFDSLDALQQAVKDGDDARKAQMSEAERVQAELVEARKKAETLDAQVREADAQRKAALLRSDAVDMMAGRFASPKTAYKLLDLSKIEISEDGTVKGLKEAVDKLAQDEPWTLASKKDQKELTPRIGATNPDAASTSQKTSDEEKRSRFFGSSLSNSGFFSGGGVKNS